MFGLFLSACVVGFFRCCLCVFLGGDNKFLLNRPILGTIIICLHNHHYPGNVFAPVMPLGGGPICNLLQVLSVFHLFIKM